MAKGPGGFSVGRVSIQVVPDTSKFREKLIAELKKEVKNLKVEVPVDVDAAKAITELKALDTILKKIDGRNVNVGATVDSKGDLSKIARDLSKVGKSASEASSGFADIGRTGAIALAVLLLIAPALGLVATLIAGLPSLLFAFGFAAAAVGLGLDGIKKAAAGFAPTIERLKKSLSATFAKQLTQPFIELNKIAPVLDSGLNKIAVSLSRIISDMIKFITSAQGLKFLDTILQNTAAFFERLRPAFQDGFQALVTLAAVASTEFSVLADTFNRFAKNFLAIVNSASESGLLTEALRNLNIVLDSLLDAFNQFFAAGLKAMTVLGGPITVLFTGFTKLVVALMPILTELSKLVFDVLGEAFKQLAPIVEALTPGISTLARMLGQLLIGALRAVGPLLTTVATILNNVLLRVLSALAPFIPQIIEFFSRLGIIISEFLVVAFTALSPLLTQFLQFVTDLLIAITPLLPKLLELATVVMRTLADMLIELAPELVQLASELFPQLLRVVTDLVPVFSRVADIIIEILPYLADLASFLLDIVIPVMTSLLQTIDVVWPGIQAIIEDVLTHIQGFVNLILGLITFDWDRAWLGLQQIVTSGMSFFKNAIKLGLTLVLDMFIGLPSRIIQSLLGLPGNMFNSGQAMMRGFIDGIVSLAQTAVNKVMAVVERVRGLFPFSPAKYGPFSGSGYTTYSGRALMEDWAKGIQQGTPAAVSAVEDAMEATQTGMDINAAVTAEGFGGLQGQIVSAMSGWEVVIDANGITKLVNKTNNSNRRR